MAGGLHVIAHPKDLHIVVKGGPTELRVLSFERLTKDHFAILAQSLDGIDHYAGTCVLLAQSAPLKKGDRYKFSPGPTEGIVQANKSNEPK